MASKSTTKGLKRTALSVVLGMCFAGSVSAQSNSTGSKDTLGTTTSASVWASGALIQDRLFAYALLQYARTNDLIQYVTTNPRIKNT